MSSNKARALLGVLAAVVLAGMGCSPDGAAEGGGGIPTLPTGISAGAGVGTAGAGTIGVIPLAGTGSSGRGGTTLPSAAGSGGGGSSAGAGAGQSENPSPVGGAAGGSVPAAGAGGTAPTTTAGTGALPIVPTGEGPQLPAIVGECPQLQDGTIMAAGHKGVVISAGQGQGGPLVFYWHGTLQSPAEADRMLPGGVRDEILSAGGIIAAFNGNQSSGAAGDCSGTQAHNIADFDAADLIAACAVKNNGVDPRKLYTTGCSAGGLQSGCMAQLRSSYLAASAPNSGGVVFSQQWEDAHSPAIFTMHGGPGDMVVVTFSETSASLDMAAKSHGSFVVNCDHGGSHCGAPAALQTAAWQFMKDHPWGFTKSPWTDGFPAGVPDYCEIY